MSALRISCSRLFLVASLLSVPARADDAKPNATSTDGSESEQAKLREARAHYEEGLRRYNIADYEAAIASFKRAYLLTSAPELLFNIAQSYRLQVPAKCSDALHFYENYLRIAPRTTKRTSVEAAIADMQRCAMTEPPPAPPETPKTPPPTSPSPPPPSPPPQAPIKPAPVQTTSRSWLPLVLGGTGITLAAGGTALVVWAQIRYSQLDAQGCAPACDSADVDGPRTGQTIGRVLLVSGAVLASSGLVVWLAGRRGGADVRARITPAVGGFSAEGSF